MPQVQLSAAGKAFAAKFAAMQAEKRARRELFQRFGLKMILEQQEKAEDRRQRMEELRVRYRAEEESRNFERETTLKRVQMENANALKLKQMDITAKRAENAAEAANKPPSDLEYVDDFEARGLIESIFGSVEKNAERARKKLEDIQGKTHEEQKFVQAWMSGEDAQESFKEKSPEFYQIMSAVGKNAKAEDYMAALVDTTGAAKAQQDIALADKYAKEKAGLIESLTGAMSPKQASQKASRLYEAFVSTPVTPEDELQGMTPEQVQKKYYPDLTVEEVRQAMEQRNAKP